MKRTWKILSIMLIVLAALVPMLNAYAVDFPTIIEDDFETGEAWSLTAGAGSVSDGMMKMVIAANGTHKLTPNGWSIDGDYIAEVTAEFNTNNSGYLPSNLGFALKTGTDGKTYYFSGVRFPQDRNAGNNFGIGRAVNYETTAGLSKASNFVDISKTCYFKFIVAGDSIDVLVRYSEDEEYASLITYQNDALVGGTSQFGISIWENYKHNAGINIDKVVIYNNDCIVDSVTIGSDDKKQNLSGCIADPFADEINVKFNTEMDSAYYNNITVYEKDNKEATVDISILSSDSTSVKLGINQRLASGREYVFSYGTQATLSGTVFDKMGVLPFTAADDPVSIEADITEGKLSGAVAFGEDVTGVTIIPAVYKDGRMLRMLEPISATAENNTFSDLDIGDAESGCTVKLFGWNDVNGTEIMCEQVIIEIGE